MTSFDGDDARIGDSLRDVARMLDDPGRDVDDAGRDDDVIDCCVDERFGGTFTLIVSRAMRT